MLSIPSLLPDVRHTLQCEAFTECRVGRSAGPSLQSSRVCANIACESSDTNAPLKTSNSSIAVDYNTTTATGNPDVFGGGNGSSNESSLTSIGFTNVRIEYRISRLVPNTTLSTYQSAMAAGCLNGSVCDSNTWKSMKGIAYIMMPIYIETADLPALFPRIFDQAEKIPSHELHVLVVDVNSPDGTVSLVNRWMATNSRIHLSSEWQSSLTAYV